MAYCTLDDVKKYIPDWQEENPDATQATNLMDDAYKEIVNILLSIGESKSQTGDALEFLKATNAVCAAYKIEVASFNGHESDRAKNLKEDCKRMQEDLRKYGLPSSTTDQGFKFVVNSEREDRTFSIDEDNW